MPRFRRRLISLERLIGIPTLAISLLAISAAPAQAQGIFNLFRAFSQPPAPTPSPQSFENQFNPLADQPRRRARSRPKPIPVEQPEVRKPVEPKPPGDIANPVIALLADSTLRPGDLVMFPDGLRVFTGRSGGPHKLGDFKPLAQAAQSLPRSTRKLVAHLLPGDNTAWNTNVVRSGGKLAANPDVATTGSVSRSRKTLRSR